MTRTHPITHITSTVVTVCLWFVATTASRSACSHLVPTKPWWHLGTGVEESASSNETLFAPKRSPLAHLHTRRRLLQGQESTSAVEAEMPVGVWTLGEMGPDGSSHKLCWVFKKKKSLKRHILGFKCHFSFLLGSQNNCLYLLLVHT